MPSKHWTLVGGAVACLITLTVSLTVQAAPWIEPGDARARFALQKLADRGHLDRTISTWPVMWGSIAQGINASARSDTAATARAMAYLNSEQAAQSGSGTRAELTLSGSAEQSLVQGFDDTPKEEAQARLDLQWQGEYWAAGLSPSIAASPTDGEVFRYDGSYLAASLGNWVFGAGAIDRWWGPGWQSSLILSDNARPLPAVWVNRKRDLAPSTSWLRWIGPWNATLFVGQFQDERAINHPKLIGMRFTFRPAPGLDVGLSRAIMFGGEGRPETGSALMDAMIGRDNSQDGADNDPGNQLGSIDVRYGFALGNHSMGLYTQMMGEDEAGAFPARKSWLFGTDWTTGLFNADQQWFLEYVNTTADELSGEPMPNVTYEHFTYNSGFRHHGRSLASSFDGDAEALTFGVFQFLDNGAKLSASVSYTALNSDGEVRAVTTDPDVTYFIPASNDKVAILQLGYGTPLPIGRLELNVSGTDGKIELVGGELNQWSASAIWRYRF
ncbi:capsule assembly Wzi family protein [Marinobacter sp. chi1]|uniref:Capsule assembly Wzi family protein n=1 Tax=Marinobacter suaedae TaxID=3057675 RepID=A0ABT8VWH3_9GAMM|nr:capsule assembly Wzi family protein [Marinobacter sp. chi1]MDO3720334.1 capsule assembly Wzi family protein [Marinobacter sp. chi1]